MITSIVEVAVAEWSRLAGWILIESSERLFVRFLERWLGQVTWVLFYLNCRQREVLAVGFG